VLGSRDRLAPFRARRGVVKTRLVKLAGKGMQGARAHLRYIQRDGVTRDGEAGLLYGPATEATDEASFLERCNGDRHQFRFIVSAEDGFDYADLKPLTRRFMAQMEQDLGTKLDWVAVDHSNTGRPHTHIMLRGKDDRDENLVIAREYISRGMRERLCALVTLDLGPKTDLEIARNLRHDIGQERLTALDRRLMRALDVDRTVRPSSADPHFHALEVGRLRKLEELGLASEVVAGRWQLPQDLEQRLRRLGERGDIIRTMQRELRRAGIERAAAEQRIDEPFELDCPIIGRLVARGLSDEHRDRHYVIVDGLDGRSHYVDIGKADGVEPLPEGAIVRIRAAAQGTRTTDRTIAAIAAANGGAYNVQLHLAHDPAASEHFVSAHVRRLEAIRRLTGAVQRDVSGTWTIAPDFLKQAVRYERRRARNRPFEIDMLSPVPLDKMRHVDAATWLDRELVAEDPQPIRDSGFGREVRGALALRRQWLIEQGLAEDRGGETAYRAQLLRELERRELVRASTQFAEELGLDYREAKPGSRIDGRLSRRVDLVSGRYALIERSHDFALVPWRKVLERYIGRQVSGIPRETGISWTFARERSGPSLN
jgi:type IV secretory pathway VirD2 relaxase